MGRIGFAEILLILILAMVLFGGNKLAGVGKALGQSIREFKKEISSDGSDEKEEKAEKVEKDAEPPKDSEPDA